MDPLPIRGRQVLLRPVVEGDRARIVAIRRTEAVARWWRGEDLDEEFDEGLADPELHQYAIERTDGRVVGMIQYAEVPDPDYRHASIDIFVDPEVHREGIAPEAIRALASHLFHCGHHRLVIDPATDNRAAIDCYAAVGFRPVGVMQQ